MDKKDASVAKILAELGLGKYKEDTLTDEDEYAWKYATDADFRFAEDVKKTYSQPQSTEKT